MLFFDFTSKSRTYFHRHHFPCILRKLSWENIFRNMDKILFHSTTSFNFSFLLVIAQFSSSLSNFLLLARVFSPSPLSFFPFYRTILLLSLSSRHILSAFLVFAASAGRLSIGYLDRTNARPEWDSSLFLSLSFSLPGVFSIRPTQPVCRAYFQTKNLRQMRQKMPYGYRARWL